MENKKNIENYPEVKGWYYIILFICLYVFCVFVGFNIFQSILISLLFVMTWKFTIDLVLRLSHRIDGNNEKLVEVLRRKSKNGR